MKHLIYIEWTDRKTTDTDERVIDAENERDAMLFAVAEWWHEIGNRYPTCRILSVAFADFEAMPDAAVSITPELAVCAVSDSSPSRAGPWWKKVGLPFRGTVDGDGFIPSFGGTP